MDETQADFMKKLDTRILQCIRRTLKLRDQDGLHEFYARIKQQKGHRPIPRLLHDDQGRSLHPYQWAEAMQSFLTDLYSAEPTERRQVDAIMESLYLPSYDPSCSLSSLLPNEDVSPHDKDTLSRRQPHGTSNVTDLVDLRMDAVEFVPLLTNDPLTVLPITADDIIKALQKLRLGRSPGQDGLTAEVIRALPESTLNHLASMILERLARTLTGNDIFMADSWRCVRVHALQKPGKLRLTNVRLISSYGMAQKAFHGAVAASLKRAIGHKLELNIGGIQKGDGPTMHHATLVTLTRKCWEYKIPLAIATIDISRAFATAQHSLILRGLQDLQTPPELVHCIAWILKTSSIQITMPNKAQFIIALERGLVEGSPLSMLLLAVATHFLLKHLNMDNSFMEALITLPTAKESFSLCIPPLIWVDDWALTAASAQKLQQQVQRLTALLRLFDMTINADKIQWLANDNIPEQCIYHESAPVERQQNIVYMGLFLDAKGDLNQHMQYRQAQASAAWARTWKTTSFKSTPKGVKTRIYAMNYIKSLTWGMGAFPNINSIFTGMNTTALSPLRSLYGKKRAEDVDTWWKRVHRQLRKDRFEGIIRHPMRDVAAQWKNIGTYTQEHPNHVLSRLLHWRGQQWLGLKLQRNERPARRRGQVPLLLDKVINKIRGCETRMLDAIRPYLDADKKHDPSFHSSAPLSPPPFSQVSFCSVTPGTA